MMIESWQNQRPLWSCDNLVLLIYLCLCTHNLIQKYIENVNSYYIQEKIFIKFIEYSLFYLVQEVGSSYKKV